VANRFSIEAVFRGIDRVSAPVSRMANRMGKATRKMSRGLDRVNRKLRGIGKAAKQAFGVAGVAGAAAIAGLAVGAVIKRGADFEKSIVGAAARFGFGDEKDRTGARFKAIADAALHAGATTEFSAVQAAEALKFFAKAGFDAELSVGLLPGVTDLATAAEIDLARATDIATDSLGAFGLIVRGDVAKTQKNFIELSDKMSTVVNKSNVDMEQMFETIKKGAPSAVAAGITVDDFLASVSQLAGAGLKAEVAGTALKNVFLKLADNKVRKKLKSLGVEVERDGLTRPFANILDDLGAGLEGRSDINRAGILNQLFGLRGITAVATLLKTGTAAFREMSGEIKRADGATAALAAQLRATTAVDIMLMTSAMDGLAQSLFVANKDGIDAMIQGITDMTTAAREFVDLNPELVQSGAKVAAISVGILAIGAVVAGIGAIIGLIVGSIPALIVMVSLATLAFLDWAVGLDRVKAGLDAIKLGVADKFGQLLNLADTMTGFITGANIPVGAEARDSENLLRSIAGGSGSSTQTIRSEVLLRAERGLLAEVISGGGSDSGVVLEPTGSF